MYQARSDAILRFPYGDTILLAGDMEATFLRYPEDISLSENRNKVFIDAQIRNQYGDLLATFSTLDFEFYYPYSTEENTPARYKFKIYTQELIPVGVHYMDIRIEVTEEGIGEDSPNVDQTLVVHSEVLQVEITQSVTQPLYMDTSGQDQRWA